MNGDNSYEHYDLLAETNTIINVSKHLVIVPLGDAATSLFSEWQRDHFAQPSIDLCVIYYGSNDTIAATYTAISTYFIRQSGPKWKLVTMALRDIPWRTLYEYVWMPDDDIIMSHNDVTLMFTMASQYGLLLGAPGMDEINMVGHYKKILCRRPGVTLHYVNFVEIMAPFIRVDALELLVNTMANPWVKSGWGLDHLWPQLLGFENIGVIDIAHATHTRPSSLSSGGGFYKKYEIDPHKEMKLTLQYYNMRPINKLMTYTEIK